VTAEELITLLAEMPPNAQVFHLWDGELRTEIQHVWLTRDGRIGTSDDREVCYSTEDRPVDAPTTEENPYWSTRSTARI
jgi:hypothetical protein